MDHIFNEEKLLARLTLNPGLALTGFRTTGPRWLTYAREFAEKHKNKTDFGLHD